MATLGLCGGCGSDSQHTAVTPAAPVSSNLTKDPTLYLVGYAHLDTEWRWEYPQVIQEYLAKTLLDNFALIEKYPHYIFNFTGAYRYKMFKEYYPEDYKKLQQYVAAGRWFPAGSSVDESDVNSPTAESIFRQVLYGNEYFRHDFGKASEEYMLPDCFGFPASLPSILAHCGVKGFSTQKLSANWQPAPLVGGPNSPEKTPEGIPFNIGDLGGHGWQQRDCGVESGQLWRFDHWRSQQKPRAQCPDDGPSAGAANRTGPGEFRLMAKPAASSLISIITAPATQAVLPPRTQ